MEAHRLEWRAEPYGMWRAYVVGGHTWIASVQERVDREGWVLNIPALGPRRELFIYRSREKAMTHASRWLRLRLDRLA